MTDTDTIVNYVADSLSNRWNVTTKPNTSTFIKVICGCDKAYIINTNQIVCINEDLGLIILTDDNTIAPTPDSMSRLLQLLNPA